MKHHKTKIYQEGFTLIEILVVIAVIGFLASTIMVRVNSARIRSENTRRMAEFRQGIKALEAYRQDHGTYPFPENPDWVCWGPSTGRCMSNYNTGNDAVVAAMTPYINRPPQTRVTDPFSAGQNYLAFRHFTNPNGTKTLGVMWPYYGLMPNGLCPGLLPPGSTAVVWAPSPPGFWSGVGDNTEYSYCWENYIY